ncbi:MAG TPA: UDP-glucose 4-epimerase GalE [Rhizomicrobium sp.]|jgi:UDP-glucose 4-epimerase
MSVLVTGGAGYIGSHTAHALVDRGEKVVVLDNLSTGSQSFIPPAAVFLRGDAGNGDLVQKIIREHAVEAVMHFAASILVPESIQCPLDYYENNVVVSRGLIEACIAQQVGHFVFSSTAAVYGLTDSIPVGETAPTRPINPYGRSKLMVEWMLEDAARAHAFRYIALRYFNVAGIAPGSCAGQPRRQVAHLIKRAAQVALGHVDHLDIFGTDYPTRDGTAVRDYIHICDLVDAHLLALDHLRAGAGAGVYNCGYGTGSSVLDVTAAFERATGRTLPVRHAPRRPGDAPSVIADAARLRTTLGWEPHFNRLDTIVRSALEWESRQSA